MRTSCRNKDLTWSAPSFSVVLSCTLLLFLFVQSARAQSHDAKGKNGVVVSVSAPASKVGLDILKRGGNAVDASVATAFALAVTYPQAGNIGGGGFMVVKPGKGKVPVVVEYRETAPGAATVDLFAKETNRHGHRVVGVPGTVRGLELAHKQFGKLPWKDVVMPAMELAEKGFAIDEHLAKDLNKALENAKGFAEFKRVFGKANGQGWQAGENLVQPDLAGTLRLLAEKGPDAFYTGTIADLIVAEMKAGAGLITKTDLLNYSAHLRPAIHTAYRGYDVYGPPPPSSGGIVLCEMLNILENFPLKQHGRFSAKTMHLMTEAMRRAYCDRARYLGDPGFIQIPPFLVQKLYAKELAAKIDALRATPSVSLAKNIPLAKESDSTTHFSVIDKDGMAVANTYTLEHSFGSKVVVKEGGFLLNNEMNDFNWKPGYTNTKGAIGTKPNLIAPGKKMLSSMTPVIVLKDGNLVLVTGSPGGRTIINTVLCMVVNVLDFDMDIRAAVDAPRLHHQWFPDQISFEAVKQHPDLVRKLEDMGHKVILHVQGDAHSIRVDPKTGEFIGAADKRLSGSAVAF
jgi:gamma-glutamyltranspeptidase/glutathione hydrolase